MYKQQPKPKFELSDLKGKKVTVPPQWNIKRITKTTNLTGIVVDMWVKPYSRYHTLNERRVGLWVRQADGTVVPIFLHGEKALDNLVINE